MGFKFNEVYRKAKKDSDPISWRWSNAKRCVYKHACLINQSYHGTLARLCAVNKIELSWINGTTPDSSATPELLDKLLSTVRDERSRFMEKFYNYRNQRNYDKQHGREKAPSKYLQSLHATDYYDPRCVPLAPWKGKDHYGFIDKTGNFAIEPVFDWVEPFVDGQAIVKVENQAFSVDTRGMRIPERTA
jgi:hypothetical protein